MIKRIGLSVILFASTDMDDIFVLIAFLADRRFGACQVVAGQYIGIAALVLVSVLASLVSLVLPRDQVGLLGLLPILIGARKLIGLRRGDGQDEGASRGPQTGAVLVVAATTIANGGDNISVYTPAFAAQSPSDIAITATVFAVMTALWLALAHRLVNHPQLGLPIRRYGGKMVPFILIGLGVMILHEAGSVQLVGRLL